MSPTYDRGRLSLRAGMAYNGAHIFSYFFAACQNGEQVQPNDVCILNATDSIADPTPLGHVYLDSHFQLDAQGSVYRGRGRTAIVSGLNLNNEMFGFYQGSSQFPIQREYYKPTYTFGLRGELGREK